MHVLSTSHEHTTAKIEYLRHYFQEMSLFFGSGSEHMVVHFEDMVEDVAHSISQVYRKWGIPHTYLELQAIILVGGNQDKEHVGAKKKYKNVTLKELGITLEELQNGVQCRYLTPKVNVE
eukprot:CAMPEP_0196576160 /NCGR_PEP_ID=MMETSP1081-20130531/5498_1 /TAXON_ID=36882 /ORGANISM="Pyramimonas amylifera, Strain CCMP720" /LENGTH=119 /DNA_ID=CAMNT_0041894699 /DNA_START=180 /DNA_END=539 /DNA_ORIENTATION=-